MRADLQLPGAAGFTGTRTGMTVHQRNAIANMLQSLWQQRVYQARHGVCIGSDAEFHKMAAQRGFWLIGHPGVTWDGRSPTRAAVHCDEMLPEKLYVVRDRDIVDGSVCLLATPRTMEEELRSGTWTTIRYARKAGKPVVIVFPDGTVKTEVAEADGQMRLEAGV